MIRCLAFGIAFAMLAACGPTVKVKIEGTKDGVSVTTSQSAHDSTGLNIQVNPNINFK